MPDTVYRSVKLILQNSTNENLTVQGMGLLSGTWDAKSAPVQGELVADQSAVSWVAQSTELSVGVSGFIRLGGPAGYFAITFDRPWTGRFTTAVDTEGNRMVYSQTENLQMPDHPSVLTVMGLLNPSLVLGSGETTITQTEIEETTVTRSGTAKSK